MYADKNIQLLELERIYGKISPFELKNKLINLANGQKVKSAHALLDAGRGNPNWIATSPREAFFAFGQFALEESRRIWNEKNLGGMPEKQNIHIRFYNYIKTHKTCPGIDMLKKFIDYGINSQGFNAEDWIYELTDGIIGDNYPDPSRILTHVEKIVTQYLIKEIYHLQEFDSKFKLFAVEGATAAICYIFDSLIANELLKKGDKVAIMTPIFTPYLEIPIIPRYNFNLVKIMASEDPEEGSSPWQYPKSELKRLGDKTIKALFLVNPSNPPSEAMEPEFIKYLIETIKDSNPNLMIISDDVYGSFPDNFNSIVSALPYNCIGVYSFSKYFGVTGWRLGTIAIHENNVFDKLLKELPEDKKSTIKKRYESISTDPTEINFIDRIAADSRQVALHHTAGLSTPQQVQMAFFAIFSLLDTKNEYKNLIKSICKRRKKLLFKSLEINIPEDPYDASYYAEFDLLKWANTHYGKSFGDYLDMSYKPIDILFKLAEKSSIVLLGGSGFYASKWSVRISLANLNDSAYSKIGNVLHNILQEYKDTWENSK
ncbi:bifunctional aspartate aminotransferase and L-aspartate beta-decarboxylase [Clostridium ragsdalei P11]|uniref:Aminotransferase n=1 Tax=Clostridium ragsdalei P11 TaxID=1353534 RepID=A0A1A6AWA7_9CLOT|nr:aspartate 4-decarboxylase [Clostridium ragsdalei]OBR94332.1 bifunctional aspartate aminotransferase and L-aspartate beta-decarboxylase [Clostridium ragsdalei P11]